MNTEAVKIFYDLLGHKKQTEIRAMELSKDFNSVKRIFGDIDCITKPASAEDIKEAEKVTDKIIFAIEKQTGSRTTKIYSGNGYQLVYRIPEIELTEANREEVQAQVQQFLKDLIKKYSNDKVKLDNVGDLPRIIRITGTINIKGGKTSKFVEICKEENSKLRDYILSLKPETTLNNIKIKNTEKKEIDISLKEIIDKDERVKKLFEGDISGKPSRSEAEESLVCHLIGLGLDREQIFKVMASCRIGKWQEAHIQYREITYKKAVELVDIAKKEVKEKLQVISLNQLNSLEIKPTEWLVKDLIPKKSIVILAGKRGTFKSFGAIDLSLCV